MKYKKKEYCRCCKKRNLFSYLDLGKQPLANSYHKGIKLSEVPLEVMLCNDCYHSQLSVVVEPDEMFRDYLFVTGTTETLRNHAKALAKNAISKVKTKDKILALDIACNDGTLLEFFRDFGCEVYGVDPAKNLRIITKRKKIPVITEYWNQSVASKINKKFDIITGTNVFAHVDNEDEFLLASKMALKDEGYLILEFPYLDNMLFSNEFDTVYHEHLSYYLVNSFKTLVDRMGFHIVDVLRTSIYGGSIRFYLKKGKGKHSKQITTLINAERKKGLLSLRTYKAFGKRVLDNREKMVKLIKDLQKQGKKVIGYGASAKGNTMLNFFQIDLDYIVDDNKLKQGFLTPGRNIPIKSPIDMKKEKNELYIVILSWNFFNEIKKKIKTIRGKAKDYAIMYIPNVELKKII